MKKKKGFTLVELLAVIVILAIILVIAVPQIISTITESRKGSLASSAKLIASSAESAYASNQALGIEKTITCSDVAQLTSEDYASCSISFVDGKAQVTIIGKGKFEGMSVCEGTKENVKVVGKCPTAVEKIESLAIEGNIEGLIIDDTAGNNIRYSGAEPNNYVKFNEEDWRIIGTFKVTTSRGKEEKLMKIVRNELFSQGMSWDSSASSVNGGGGVNEWSQADLMTMLNTYYIGTSTKCSYCNGYNQSKCSNDCSSIVTPIIDSTYREMIEEVVWNTGAITYDSSLERSSAYNQERGTTTWTGKVGLIYPSDYGYASTSGTDIINSSIGTTNWLSGSFYWTISPLSSVNDALLVNNRYVFYNYGVCNRSGVRPAIYLKSDVSITSGDGTEDSPYQISMN